MDYIDHYEYNQDKKIVDVCRVSINGTIFKSNVFYIKQDFTWKWLVREKSIIKIKNRGLNAYIHYDGTWYNATINAQGNVQKVRGKKELENGTLQDAELLRCEDRSFKVNYEQALTYKLAEKFSATAFAVRMNEVKGKTIDLGESIPMAVAYTVKAGEPVVYMLMADHIPFSPAGAKTDAAEMKTIDVVRLKDEDPVKIDGAELPARLCRSLEERFTGMRIALQPQKTSDDTICWDRPSPWYDISRLDELGGRQFAVYMWRGYEKKDPNKHYVYVGIAGNSDKSANTVRARISSEQKARPHIKITHFRFSALQSWGRYSPAEILKTVEMQCINNLSALFPLAHKQDPEVIPVYERVGTGEEGFILRLENKSNRFRNT